MSRPITRLSLSQNPTTIYDQDQKRIEFTIGLRDSCENKNIRISQIAVASIEDKKCQSAKTLIANGVKRRRLIAVNKDEKICKAIKKKGFRVEPGYFGEVVARLGKSKKLNVQGAFMDFCGTPMGNKSKGTNPSNEIRQLLKYNRSESLFMGITFSRRCKHLQRGERCTPKYKRIIDDLIRKGKYEIIRDPKILEYRSTDLNSNMVTYYYDIRKKKTD